MTDTGVAIEVAAESTDSIAYESSLKYYCVTSAAFSFTGAITFTIS
jgi:hypothetical protein